MCRDGTTYYSNLDVYTPSTHLVGSVSISGRMAAAVPRGGLLVFGGRKCASLTCCVARMLFVRMRVRFLDQRMRSHGATVHLVQRAGKAFASVSLLHSPSTASDTSSAASALAGSETVGVNLGALVQGPTGSLNFARDEGAAAGFFNRAFFVGG